MEQLGSGLHVAVYVNNVLWDQFIVLEDNGVLMYNNNYCPHFKYQKFAESKHVNCTSSGDSIITEETTKLSQYLHSTIKAPLKPQKHSIQFRVNGYFLSLFVKLLERSVSYRQHTISNFGQCSKLKSRSNVNNGTELALVQFKLFSPKCEVIDLNWNYRIEWMLMERRELDHAMSWFSTFGGAFSALGEEFEHCADMAGKISLQQLGLALRLGDPLTVARCKLYWALSKIQQGHLKDARHIIEAQYSLARCYISVDERLVRMCHGIWAKLKYTHHLRLVQKKLDSA